MTYALIVHMDANLAKILLHAAHVNQDIIKIVIFANLVKLDALNVPLQVSVHNVQMDIYIQTRNAKKVVHLVVHLVIHIVVHQVVHQNIVVQDIIKMYIAHVNVVHKIANNAKVVNIVVNVMMDLSGFKEFAI